MRYRKLTSVLLAVLMLTGAFFGAAVAQADEPAKAAETDAAVQAAPGAENYEVSDVDTQLALFVSHIADLKQQDGELTWYYAVTDLDHDGNLEFVAASQHPADRSTNLKAWQVNTDRTDLVECSLRKDPDESFPDILTDSCDTFHDTESDTWLYLFYDNIVISDSEVYTAKSAYHLEDGVIGYDAYAVEHTKIEDGVKTVSHTDMNGIPISPEQYNAAGVNAFAGMERSNTAFDWFAADEADKLSRLADSFAVFMGIKAAPETFPVLAPAALAQPAANPEPTPAPSASPAPAATPVPAPQPAYTQPIFLSITKNPTNENRTVGDTALFVANANAFDSLSWTMVSPYGGEYAVEAFSYMCPDAPISGMYSTTLSIGNVAMDMNGWGAYCTFYYGGQTARTSTAYLYVSEKKAAPVAPAGAYSGVVTDWSYSTVTVSITGGATLSIPWSISDLTGEVYYGAPAAVLWDGKTVTYCYVQGNVKSVTVTETYGSMSGTAYRNSDSTLCIYLQNGNVVYVPSYSTGGYSCFISGVVPYAGGGASCVVFYVGSPVADNIYSVEVYGEYSSYTYYGGYAGSQYYVEEEYYPYDYDLHTAFRMNGTTYEAVYCPICGSEVALAYDICPYCGFDF